MRQLLTVFIVACLLSSATAQTLHLTGTPRPIRLPALDSIASHYEIIKLAAPVKSGNYSQVQLPGNEQPVPMLPRTGLVEGAQILPQGQATSQGFKTWQQPQGQPNPFNLAINDGFVLGEFTRNGKMYLIEQVGNFIPGYAPDVVMIYAAETAIRKNVHCGVPDSLLQAHQYNHVQKQTGAPQPQSTCRTIDYAMVADHSMFLKYGTVQATVNYMMGIMNLVQGNYDSEFANEYRYKINQVLVFTNAAVNPWPSTNDINLNLTNFASWANANLNSDFDICSYWFNTPNFSSGTVGLAWLSYICNRQGSNAIREYGTSANNMRVLVAHEIGHNLSAGHDASGSGFIMAPQVNNTTTWSPASLTAINNFFASASANCVTACNVQPCHNSFAASYQAVYDTATNRVQFNWTDAANLPTRIRWRNLAGTALDSVVLTNHGGSYTLQLPCGGMRYR